MAAEMKAAIRSIVVMVTVFWLAIAAGCSSAQDGAACRAAGAPEALAPGGRGGGGAVDGSKGVALVQLKPGGRVAMSKTAAARSGSVADCFFPVQPMLPYYWEPACKADPVPANGGKGCRADGIHDECRYCGVTPHTDIDCPETGVAMPYWGFCKFDPDLLEPALDYFWDPVGCKDGGLGCKADGKHDECRYCGTGGDGSYASVPCPACDFAGIPSLPWFWDNSCRRNGGGEGCNADGRHLECRYCGAFPFEGVPCPANVMPTEGKCYFPGGAPLGVGHYWAGDGSCKRGVLGCLADGVHEECRFCGGDGPYINITCPPSNP